MVLTHHLWKYIYFLVLNLIISHQNFGQELDFKTAYSRSLEYSKTYDTLANSSSSTSHKPQYEALMFKDLWSVDELNEIENILNQIPNSNTGLQGIYYYISGNAYSGYDDKLRLGFYQKAYLNFERENDLIGKFFSLNKMFAMETVTREIELSKEQADYITSKFVELQNLLERITYVPAQLSFIETKIDYYKYLDKPISEQELNTFQNSILKHEDVYPNIVKGLYTNLGRLYMQKEKYEIGKAYYKKALNFANPKRYDYPSYLYNLGSSYYYLRKIDSAKYNFTEAFNKIPKQIQTAYLALMKRNIAYNLAAVYNFEKDYAAASYYLQQALSGSELHKTLVLDKNNAYADKKFEVQKAELKVAKKELQLFKEQQRNKFYLVGLTVAVMIVIVLYFIYNRTKQLKDEANQLKDRREQLLRIVSHDLGEPLQVFSDSSVIIPKLIQLQRYDALKEVQYSMSETILSLQGILKNLFSWNTKTSNQNLEEATAINVIEQLNLILKSYEDVAKIKELNINFKHDTGVIFKSNAFKINNLFRNIIYNAIKHSNPNTTVDIQVAINTNHHLQFECQNTIKPHSKEDVEELINHFNGIKSLDYLNTGLGLELIDDALKSLNAKIMSKLDKNTLEIKITIPQYHHY